MKVLKTERLGGKSTMTYLREILFFSRIFVDLRLFEKFRNRILLEIGKTPTMMMLEIEKRKEKT